MHTSGETEFLSSRVIGLGVAAMGLYVADSNRFKIICVGILSEHAINDKRFLSISDLVALLGKGNIRFQSHGILVCVKLQWGARRLLFYGAKFHII